MGATTEEVRPSNDVERNSIWKGTRRRWKELTGEGELESSAR